MVQGDRSGASRSTVSMILTPSASYTVRFIELLLPKLITPPTTCTVIMTLSIVAHILSFMVASPEVETNAHSFWYASVIGIFYADVQHTGHCSQDFNPKHMEFLWIQWLGLVPGRSFGRKRATLPKVGFIPDSDEFAFGFLDPALIIRGCHLFCVS